VLSATRLPDTVYFCEDPQVCRWNEQLQQWQVDGFNDRVYNEGESVQSNPLSCAEEQISHSDAP